MPHDTAVAIHVGVGTLALLAYWFTLTTAKGTPRHRAAGKISLALLLIVSLSVGPVLFWQPGPFDPRYAVQMVYLVACVATVSFLAVSAIRFRTRPDRFRGRHVAVLGPLLLGLGLVVLAAGIAKADPVAVTLSWVGLAFGSALIAFRRYQGPLHSRWWLSWHLNATCALFNAVNGTVLYVLANRTGLVTEGAAAQTAFQLATIGAAVAMRLWFGTKFKAPIRFGRKMTNAALDPT